MKRRILLNALAVIVCFLITSGGGTVSRGADQSAPVVAAEAEGRRPELVQNPDFETDELRGWSLEVVGGAQGRMEREATVRERETNSHSLRLTVMNPGQRCGVSNQGASGIEVKSGNWYDLTFQARTEKRENDRGYGLTISLESQDGSQVWARTTLPEVGGDWKSYTVALHARGADSKARLVISMSEPGTIWLDDVSLLARAVDGGQ